MVECFYSPLFFSMGKGPYCVTGLFNAEEILLFHLDRGGSESESWKII